MHIFKLTEKQLIKKEFKKLILNYKTKREAAKAAGCDISTLCRWMNVERKVDPIFLYRLKKIGLDIKKIRPDLADILK